eukprot:CAMPEP_0119357546 /NCGR_PEP_ID=MMETSP1334-20130426/5902_1 /TAXON_ID=127549 /ORGANISM="Calcidiscus leptoporus, Strain RCC1130" /LENGTH=138 /DNA_ID=CAMNT_0007371821 /DNA_START=101 /DNA_END=517 /DNA_ORIENTATION=-
MRLLTLSLIACTTLTAPVPEEPKKPVKPVAKSLFSNLTKSLSQEKRPQFMELMKKMRMTKIMKKEDKKVAIVQLDAEIHKLLGDDYKKYRSVQDQVHKERQALHAVSLPPPPPPPPPLLAAATGLLKKKKKKKGAAIR